MTHVTPNMITASIYASSPGVKYSSMVTSLGERGVSHVIPYL